MAPVDFVELFGNLNTGLLAAETTSRNIEGVTGTAPRDFADQRPWWLRALTSPGRVLTIAAAIAAVLIALPLATDVLAFSDEVSS